MMQTGSFLSRATALLIFIAACAVVFLAFVEPLMRQNRFYDETLATLHNQRARFAAEAAALPRLRARLAAVKLRPGPRNAYISGGSASRAAASLLEAIKTTVQSGGATLVSAQVLTKAAPEADSDRATKIAVRTQMKATPEALQRVFHGLESGRPTLFVSDVTITGRRLKKTIRVRGKRHESWEELLLDVRFAVTGFRRLDAKNEAPK